jgi:hypothetical protein
MSTFELQVVMRCGGPLGDGLHVIDGRVSGRQQGGFSRDHKHPNHIFILRFKAIYFNKTTPWRFKKIMPTKRLLLDTN